MSLAQNVVDAVQRQGESFLDAVALYGGRVASPPMPLSEAEGKVFAHLPDGTWVSASADAYDDLRVVMN